MQYYLLYFSLIYVLIYHELESKKTWLFYTPMWHHPSIGGGGDQVWSSESDAVLVVPTPNSNSMQRLRERRSRQERDESSNHRAPPP